MAKLTKCPTCKERISSEASACPKCGQPRPEAGWPTEPGSPIAGVLLLVGIGWLAFHLFSGGSSDQSRVPPKPAVMSYPSIATQLHDKLTQAVPMYGDLRRNLVAIIKDPAFQQGKSTSGIGAWATEEQTFQTDTTWNGLTLSGARRAPLPVRTVLRKRIEALRNLDTADNMLFMAYEKAVSTCNGAVSAYTPYLRAADAADALAKEDLAGKFVGRPLDAVMGEPDYVANAPDPQAECPQM